MNKAESKMRGKLLKLLRKAGCHAFAVENPLAYPGTPDVFAAKGSSTHSTAGLSAWVELKVAPTPKNVKATFKVEVRPAQRVWHTNQRRAGAMSWFLTEVGDGWYLHDGLWAATHLGRCSYDEFTSAAVTSWYSRKLHHSTIAQALLV